MLQLKVCMPQLRVHIPQLRIPHATAKTQCSQINIFKKEMEYEMKRTIDEPGCVFLMGGVKREGKIRVYLYLIRARP